LQILKSRGINIIEPATGLLACGTVGKGRLPEPSEICAEVVRFFDGEILAGKKILVTAGGTLEPIDPVRYISNSSSGKMGYEIATAASRLGAEVILVSASSLPAPKNVRFVKVESAEQMQTAVLADFETIDAVVMAAAVSDYRVKNVSAQKIKKDTDTLTLELVKNPDILKGLGQRKKNQVLVGFAAETENLIEYAKKKLAEKNLDFIVANDVTAEGAGFGVDTNIASLIYRDGSIENFTKMTKKDLAEKIIRRVANFFN